MPQLKAHLKKEIETEDAAARKRYKSHKRIETARERRRKEDSAAQHAEDAKVDRDGETDERKPPLTGA